MSFKKWVIRKIDKCIICKEYATSRELLTENYDFETMSGGCIYQYEHLYMCHWCHSVITEHYLKLFPVWFGVEENPLHEYNKYVGKYYFDEEYDRIFRKITNINGKLQSYYPNRKNANAETRESFIFRRQLLIKSVQKLNKYHEMVNVIKLLQLDVTSFLNFLPLEILNHIIFYL